MTTRPNKTEPSDPLTVDLEMLRRVFQMTIDELERVSGPTTTLEIDYFWSIPPSDRFDVNSEPTANTVGQLSEVIAHLRDLDTDPNRLFTHHIVWLGELLQGIGHNHSYGKEPR